MTAKKPLTERQIRNRLQKKVDSLFTKAEQERLEFYPDVDAKFHYSWVMKWKGRKIELACNKINGTITFCQS
jgi:hypothetical protein